MSTLNNSPLFVSYGICISLVFPLHATSALQLRQDSRKDTLKSDSLLSHLANKGSILRPLPNFNPKRDTAGFQLIPKQIHGDVVIDREILILPYDQEPEIVKKVEPAYPESGIPRRLEGKVFVKIYVGKDGKAQQVRVIKSDNEIFNRPAIEAANQFAFTPAYRNHKPVAAWLTYQFQFKIPRLNPE